MNCPRWKDRMCETKGMPCEVVKDCPEYNDLTPKETMARAGELISMGANIYIKFTCHQCGSRQTSMTPNVVHTNYSCEECGKITYPRRFGFLLTMMAR